MTACNRCNSSAGLQNHAEECLLNVMHSNLSIYMAKITHLHPNSLSESSLCLLFDQVFMFLYHHFDYRASIAVQYIRQFYSLNIQEIHTLLNASQFNTDITCLHSQDSHSHDLLTFTVQS